MEVGEVMELFPAEVARVVSSELGCKVGGGGEDSICWSDGGVY